MCAGFQSHGAGILGGSSAVVLGEGQHTEDATHRKLAQIAMHGLAQRADMRSSFFGAVEQLAGERVQDAELGCVPLHVDAPSDPARRRAVVSSLDFDAAIQVHRALAVLVIAKRFQRQGRQRRTLFGSRTIGPEP